MDDNPLIKKCTKPWCKRTFPSESKYKTCEHCRQHDRDNQKANRARQKDADAEKDQPLSAGQKHQRPETELEEPPATRQRTNNDSNPCENEGDSTSDDDNEDEFGVEPDETVIDGFFLTK